MRRLVLFDALHSGSHAAWSTGLAAHLPACGWHVHLVTLPGRHWKWRMQGAAWWFGEAVQREGLPVPDALLVTDMVDVARLRGCLPPVWRSVPIALYLHENQATFPWNAGESGTWRTQYAFINALSAWTADGVWFNSAHHRDVFMEAVPEVLRRLPDARVGGAWETLGMKSRVLPPGLSVPEHFQGSLDRPLGKPVVLVWNHRWSADKHPEHFVATLRLLQSRGIAFAVDLLGVGDREAPGPLREVLADPGIPKVATEPAASRVEYWTRLGRADVIVHHPLQEYFGISVVEALYAGVLPLLPDGHAYPEYAAGFRVARTPHQAASGVAALAGAPDHAVAAWRREARRRASPFEWTALIASYGAALDALLDSG